MQKIQLFIQTSFPFKQHGVINPYHNHDLPYLLQISFQRPNLVFTELAKFLKCLGLCYKFINEGCCCNIMCNLLNAVFQ